MIKRTRYYSEVEGVTLDDNGEVKHTAVIVDGRCKNADIAMKKAKRHNPTFLPTSAVYHMQECTMADDIFYNNAKFGDDSVIDYPGNTAEEIVSDEITEEENN